MSQPQPHIVSIATGQRTVNNGAAITHDIYGLDLDGRVYYWHAPSCAWRRLESR